MCQMTFTSVESLNVERYSKSTGIRSVSMEMGPQIGAVKSGDGTTGGATLASPIMSSDEHFEFDFGTHK